MLWTGWVARRHLSHVRPLDGVRCFLQTRGPTSPFTAEVASVAKWRVCTRLDVNSWVMCQPEGMVRLQMVGQKQSLLAALPGDNPLVAGRAPSPRPPGVPAAVRSALAAQAALDREVCTLLLSPPGTPWYALHVPTEFVRKLVGYHQRPHLVSSSHICLCISTMSGVFTAHHIRRRFCCTCTWLRAA